MLNKTETIYTIDDIMELIMSGEHHDQYDTSKLVSAYDFAARAHANQMRSSGEPYISHPVAVSYILLQLGMDTDTVCAGFLHDVVEDTDFTLEDIRKNFGQDVAMLVDGVTKLGKIPLFTKEEQQAENVRKILLAMSQDIRVIIIKLADRLHNMRTLQFRPAYKQRATSLETMNIYAPIAHRLGIKTIQDEIEDIAFHYLDPYAYSEIENALRIRSDEREQFISHIKGEIEARYKEMGLDVPQIAGRVKSVYGIYKKAYTCRKSIDEVYDIYAVRIIVGTVNECYNALGIIHDMYKPIPNRFKDYIATPKSNMYQSLHTTVIGTEGIPFEVQIRTVDMNNTAEYGIAAHWKYKEGIKGKDRFDNRLAWIRRIIEAQQSADDVEEIVRTIKNDLSPEDTFAFTPKGDMITLPAGATIIDFAYAIHTEVGNKMKGAKVDGKLVSLDYQLKTGEIVEILTSNASDHGPNRAWLDIAKTNEAKSKIRSWFKREKRDENVAEGRDLLEKEFKRNGISVPQDDLAKFLADDMKRHNCETLDDFYAALGYGGIILSKILPRLKDNYLKQYVNNSVMPAAILPKYSSTGVIVGGENNIEVRLSRCCNPLPGEDIVAFVTKGHGFSIHRSDCETFKQSAKGPSADRWIPAHWAENSVKNDNPIFKATIDIVAYNGLTLPAEVTAVTAEMRIPLMSFETKVLKNGNADIVISCHIAGVEQLQLLLHKLQKIPDVISADRIFNC